MATTSQKIVPHLWYDREATEAAEFYTSVFPESSVTSVTTIHDTPSGDCEVVSFELWGKRFNAISAGPLFEFNPSISFMVNFDPLSFMVYCEDQAGIDHYWENLSAVPEAERCGWLKDRFGVSWQIVPAAMDEMMRNGTREQVDRVTRAFLDMKKFDIAALKRAHEGA